MKCAKEDIWKCLILKKDKACRFKDFRPINFVMSLYKIKIVAKMLANRLIKVLNMILDFRLQGAFIAGRNFGLGVNHQ